MANELHKSELVRLAKLARIDLDAKEEERLLRDVQHIVDYVSELQAADTAGVMPVDGGGDAHDIFRDDDERENTNRGKGTELFPSTHKGYLRVPPVFE